MIHAILSRLRRREPEPEFRESKWLSGFFWDKDGGVWQPCPNCGGMVIPSHNGWTAHLRGCPSLRDLPVTTDRDTRPDQLVDKARR